VLHDLGRLAEARRDWTGAEQVWRSLIALDGGPSWAHIGLADALHNQRRFADGSAALTAVFGRLGHEPTVFIHHARLAERSRDWAAAVDRWNEFARRFPRRIEGHTGVVRALAEQGRINEAEVALVSAQSLFSDQASLFEDYARLAESRNDWNEALARWETVRSRFPSIWNAYAKVAWMLILLGRLDEAEAVYRSAPDGIAGPGVLAAALAGLARRQKDPAREEQSWRDALAQASEQWWPVKGLAGSLANQRRFNEARALLRDAALRFPDDPGPPMELARIAETQALFPEAIEQWEAGRRRFPGNWEMWTGTAEAHAAAREFDAADDMYHQAQQAFPDLDIILIRWAVFRARHAEVNFTRSGHLIAAVFETYFQQYPETAPLRLAQAQLLRSIDDLDAALKVLAAAGKAFPSEQRIPVEFATVRDLAISLNRDTPLDLAPDLVPADEDAKLFSRFESLGGGGRSEDGWGFGCEFGFVQRNVGLEPLGLLRWASIGPGNLIRALRSGFANVGSEDTTIIREWGAEEWAATDTNFNIIMDHTHLPIAQVPAARARTLVMRKLTFLTRKLLEDLSGGDKIFVYRLLGRAIDAATLDDLAAAIRTYGNNTLLFVAYADAAHPSGSVERLREGLLVGYIDWFAPDRDNLPCNLSGWRSVCAAALRVIAA
jgi:tetratricopeptide (TPR) repeat protein